ncbi:MAG: Ig-like domain-containing protein [Nitrososphaera sp.]|nr:Ig-like domain-containing protein [Nitrososphaera sp.]
MTLRDKIRHRSRICAQILGVGLIVALLSAFHFHYALGLSTWAMRLGGPGTDDVFRAIEPLADGGYIVAGSTNSFGAGRDDVWLIKLDEDANVEWQRTYGGQGGDTARSVKPTPDGGFVVAGQTHSFSAGRSDVWVLKFDHEGNLQWQKSYGGPSNDIAHAIEPTLDGGYLAAGFTASFGAASKDYFVIKLDSDGDIVWQKRYGGDGADVIRFATQVSNGHYFVAGFTHSFGAKGDIMVLRLDSDGDIVWQKRYGGAKFEEPSTILRAPGGYIVLEQSTSFSSNTDGWVFKLDPGGNMIWQKRHGGGSFDELSAARMTPDGGFIAAGETKSFGAVNEDFWVVKFDSGGSIMWQKRYGGADIDEAEGIALTPEGGFIVVGTTRSFDAVGKDVWILRLDANGELEQCSSGVTANSVTAATSGNTNAVPAMTTAFSVDTSATTKIGKPTVATSTAPIMLQCGVTAIDTTPVAEDDQYSTDEDTPLNVPAPGVLGNDSDVDGDALAALLVSGPSSGELVLNTDGSFTYTPDDDISGVDSFTYKANDGITDSNIATVSITVNPVNDPPVAGDDQFSADENTPLVIAKSDLLSNDLDKDGDTLFVASSDLVSTAGGTITDNGDGTLTYDPPPDFNGVDTFDYIASDGELVDEGTVEIEVASASG